MEKVIILVDVQNIYYTTKQANNCNFDYNEFWAEVTKNRIVMKAIAYSTDRGDETEINAVIQALRNAETKHYVEDEPSNLSRYGLDQPRLQVEFLQGMGNNIKRKTVLVGDRARASDNPNATALQYYGKDASRPAVFLVDSATVGTLSPEVFTFRYKNVVEFERTDVQRIMLDYGDSTFVCALDSANMWQLVEPEVRAGKDWKISGILSDLEALRATAFVDYDESRFASYGLRNPRATVRLLNEGMEEVLRVSFGRTEDDDVYFVNHTTKRLYTVRDSAREDLMLGLSDLSEEPEPEEEPEEEEETV